MIDLFFPTPEDQSRGDEMRESAEQDESESRKPRRCLPLGLSGQFAKARRYALAGAILGAFGLGSALWSGRLWSVAFSAFVYGSTMTLVALTWRGTR